MASSINLALKSATSSRRLSRSFKTFLTRSSLPCSFLSRVARPRHPPYIALLEERYAAELDDLMKIQIREYIAFIKDFTERANIMTKNFFIVVPYDPALIAAAGEVAARSGLAPRGGKESTLAHRRAV
jgi:hypothetical protein